MPAPDGPINKTLSVGKLSSESMVRIGRDAEEKGRFQAGIVAGKGGWWDGWLGEFLLMQGYTH